MNNDGIKLSEKSRVDLINEKIISLTFRAELQRRTAEYCLDCDDVLTVLTREMLENV
jgi:hypothetical protein